MSTHRLCCCGPAITCEEWCECAPGIVRVSFSITQTLRNYLSTGLVSEYTETLTVTNARLAYDSTLCRLSAIGGAGNGTWSYSRSADERTTPLNGTEPNCPHTCGAAPIPCQGSTMVGSGNVTTDSIRIRCGDPCSEQFGTPVVDEHLLLEFEVVATVTVTETIDSVCAPIYGTPPPPYTLNLILEGVFIADLECLDIHSFDTRGLRWPMPFGGGPIDPATICKGANNPYGWVCIGGFGTPIRVVPNYESSQYAKTCPEFWCVDGHICYAATPPYAPTFSCVCGDENSPGNGAGTEWNEWTRTHTVSLQIP